MGRLELIIGTMFSGKSTKLIKRVNKLKIAGYTAQMFKPIIDDRYDKDKIVSHDKLEGTCIPVHDVNELLQKFRTGTDVIAIDEVQFLEEEIIKNIENWINSGNKIVIVAGLLFDFRNELFYFKHSKKSMFDLIALVPDSIDYIKAICTYEEAGKICGKEAVMAQRVTPEGKVAPKDSQLVQVGGKESYAVRCREHYVKYEK